MKKTLSVAITIILTVIAIIGTTAVFDTITVDAASKKKTSYTLPVKCTTYYRVGKEGKWQKKDTVTYKYDKYGNVKSYTVDGRRFRIKNRYKNKMLYSSSNSNSKVGVTRYYGSNGACIRQITSLYKKGILKGEVVTNFESNRKGFITKAEWDREASSSWSVISRYWQLSQATETGDYAYDISVKNRKNGTTSKIKVTRTQNYSDPESIINSISENSYYINKNGLIKKEVYWAHDFTVDDIKDENAERKIEWVYEYKKNKNKLTMIKKETMDTGELKYYLEWDDDDDYDDDDTITETKKVYTFGKKKTTDIKKYLAVMYNDYPDYVELGNILPAFICSK